MGKQLSKCMSRKSSSKHYRTGTTDTQHQHENCMNVLLHLIYCDLAARSVTNGVGLDTFVEFYHLNGLWTQEVFAVFDKNSNGDIDQQQFTTVIRQLTTQKDENKKEVLFNFYDAGHKGFIEYSQLLRMFYSYPKKELTQLLKSKEFQQTLTVADQLELLDKHKTNNQISAYDITKNMAKQIEDDVQSDEHSPYKSNLQHGTKDDLLQIKMRQSLSLKPSWSLHSTTTSTTNSEGARYLTCKINMLIKRYTQYLFRELGLNYKKDSLTKEMFFQLIGRHPQLYQTYRDGFHTYLWECSNGVAEMSIMNSSVEGICTEFTKCNRVKRYLRLVGDALVVFDMKNRDMPIETIFIRGLIVQRYSCSSKIGFVIKHRDNYYPEHIFLVESTEQLEKWMEQFNSFLGQTIQSKYTLQETIGAGAHSTVSKCLNKKEGKLYAVKIIDRKKVTEVEAELIWQEMKILLNLPHPNIAKLKQTFQTPNEHYIVNEFFEDKDLFEYLNEKGHCAEDEALLITRKMLSVLKFLKDNGLIHRDLKPENIMVIKDSEKKKIVDVKLIDFGFAVYQCTLKAKSGDHLCVGTINYVAPEILSMDETFDYKVDMFSLGVVIFNMQDCKLFRLSGELPFDHHHNQMVIRNTLRCSYSMRKQTWKQVSEKAKEFVRKILVTDPDKRISVEQALEDPWITGVERDLACLPICKHKSCESRI